MFLSWGRSYLFLRHLADIVSQRLSTNFLSYVENCPNLAQKPAPDFSKEHLITGHGDLHAVVVAVPRSSYACHSATVVWITDADAASGAIIAVQGITGLVGARGEAPSR